MTIRILAASLAAFLGTGLALASVEASARPGGPAGGGAFSARAAFRPHAVRPPVSLPRRAVGTWAALRAHPARLSPWRHRAFVGFPGWGLAGYGGYYAPANYVVIHEQGPQAYPAVHYPPLADAPAAVRVIYVMSFQRGCRSEVQEVLSPDGGEITVIRC